MKNFITTVAALIATTSLTAQAQSEWEPNEDVTQYLEWGAYDGSTQGNDYWTWSSNPGYTYNSWEFFDQPDGTEFYQIFTLPAGYYEFNVQAFYRGGDWQKDYWTDNYSSAAEFFASSGDYNEDGDFVVTRDNFVPIVSLASSEVTGGRLYDTSDWEADVEYTPTGKSKYYYVPNSMAGARAFFDEGYYNTNSLKVIQKEDGPIKLGIRKNAESSSNDWVLWSNFTCTFISEASEAIQLELARQTLDDAIANAEALEDNYADYPALQTLYQDAKEELRIKGDDAETVEEIETVTKEVEALIEEYKGYKKDAESLKGVIKLSEQEAAATDLVGKPGFEAAIDAAKKVCNDNDPDNPVVTAPTDYKNATHTLASARADYAMSNGATEDGSYDFTNVVAYPWFCDVEHNPKFNAESNKWEYDDYTINGADTLEGWGSVGESEMTKDRVVDGTTHYMVNIAQNVTIDRDTTAILSWYQKGTADWNKYVPYWNMQLTSAKHWATPGSEEIIAQNIVGLPDGYYSLTGKGITWTNDWNQGDFAGKDVNMGIFFTSNGKTTKSAESVVKCGWWGDVTNQDTWTDFSTGMVEVKGGEARIGFFNNGFGAFTGMRLTYYGANPDFTDIIKNAVKPINSEIEELLLTGDQAAVKAILTEIPKKVEGFEAYEAALKSIAEAEAYIKAAKDCLDNNDISSITNELQAKYKPESKEYTALDAVLEASYNFYSEETATYKDLLAFIANIEAYAHYFDKAATMAKDVNTDEMNLKIAEQMDALQGAMSDTETLQGYEDELAAIRSNKILADLNIDKASEGNPVDVTVLLTNPSFETGDNTGWDGEITVDKDLKSAERYNTNFDISQTVKNLPAGAYEVQVKAFYRDGNSQDAFEHIYNPDDEDTFTPNVKLYANERATDVVSIANMDAQFTERSFTSFVYAQEELEEGTYKDLYERCEERDSISEETGETVYIVTSYKEVYQADGTISEEAADDAWIYDYWDFDGDTRLFYPNSMRGATARFDNNGEAYTNTVQVMVGEDGVLKLGLKKDTTINYDWCMFDDFKLFYLGKDTPSAINGTSGNNAKAQKIFSVDGRQTKSMQKGLNIVKMSDGSVRKILVK